MSKDVSIEEALNTYGVLMHHIRGVSMMPMLRQDKDVVKIIPFFGKLEVNDVPLYKRKDGSYVLHRAIKIEKDYCITLGDNCIRKEKVPYSSIIGVMDGFFRGDVYVSNDCPEYLDYVKKRRAKYPLRVLRYIPVSIGRKIKRIIKHK